MGSFKTLVFVLRRCRKLESAMGQNRRMGKKGWTHTSLVDYLMATRTFQTWFHRCSTVSYFGPLLLRSHLVVRGNDNWQTDFDPHLRDVSEGNQRWSLPPDIQNMLSIMGKAQDAKIAETMVAQGIVSRFMLFVWGDKSKILHCQKASAKSDMSFL